jgi:hypothetical protein
VSEKHQDFAKIPEDDDMATVLYAVPGTDVADDSVMDAQVPQTSSVDRKTASLTVEYDGEPEFEDIPKSTMRWAATGVIAGVVDAADDSRQQYGR